MRNRWFPARVADYVPATQMKQLKAQDVDMARDFTYGVRLNLEEVEEEEDDFAKQPKHYVRPIEINVLSVCLYRTAISTHTNKDSLHDPWNSSTPSYHQRSTSTANGSSKKASPETAWVRLVRQTS